MWTVVLNLLLFGLTLLVILKIKSYFNQKKRERLNQEIDVDFAEEFPNIENLEPDIGDDFLDWAEGLQRENENDKNQSVI
jgi:hypothetical protein